MRLFFGSLTFSQSDQLESTKSGLDAQSKELLAQVEVERKQREEETRKLEAKNRAQLAEIQQKQNEERIALQKEKVRPSLRAHHYDTLSLHLRHMAVRCLHCFCVSQPIPRLFLKPFVCDARHPHGHQSTHSTLQCDGLCAL